MSRLPFTKVQGLGNDFLVVDLRTGRAAAALDPAPTDPQWARALCDRHFGVGADGVLAVLESDAGDARMRVINADGSEAEMCGNGIRCVAKFLWETDPNLRRPVINIDTRAGVLACAIEAAGDRVRSVAVEMGRPRLTRGELPMTGPSNERAVRAPVRVGDRSFSFTAVSMGNPHAVIFVDEPGTDLRALAETYGPRIEVDAIFPRRANVEFARLRGQDIDLVVWERGCGITLACGTGACATVVAACLEGRMQPGREVPVHLPGGTLAITVAPDAGPSEASFAGVKMRGPAETVFQAEIDPKSLLMTSR